MVKNLSVIFWVLPHINAVELEKLEWIFFGKGSSVKSSWMRNEKADRFPVSRYVKHTFSFRSFHVISYAEHVRKGFVKPGDE